VTPLYQKAGGHSESGVLNPVQSDNGVPIQTIADLAGRASTAVTEEVCRHQLKPVITRGAETMNAIFSTQNPAPDAPDAKNQAKSA
jgi:hypothetical protein